MTSKHFFNLTVSVQHYHNGMPFALTFTHQLACLVDEKLTGKEPRLYAHWNVSDGQWESGGRRCIWITCELFQEIFAKAPIFTGEQDRTVLVLKHSQRISVLFKKDGTPIMQDREGTVLLTERVAELIARAESFESW